MIIPDLDPSSRRHLIVAIGWLRRNGVDLPGLASLAAVLAAADRDDRDAGLARRRALARDRQRRSRARKRGEDVPLRRPGPRRRAA